MRLILPCILTAALFALTASPASARPHRNKHDPGTCALSVNQAGDLLVSGSGFEPSTELQYQLYSIPTLEHGSSVGGGQITSDASGNINADLGPLSFYLTVYPGETGVMFDLYPIVGNAADMGTVIGNCEYGK